MNQHQIAQHSQMMHKIDMKACWLFAVNFVVCAVTIISLSQALLILASSPQINLLDYRSTPVSLSGALDVEHFKKNLLMILPEKLNRQPVPKI